MVFINIIYFKHLTQAMCRTIGDNIIATTLSSQKGGGYKCKEGKYY